MNVQSNNSYPIRFGIMKDLHIIFKGEDFKTLQM